MESENNQMLSDIQTQPNTADTQACTESNQFLIQTDKTTEITQTSTDSIVQSDSTQLDSTNLCKEDSPAHENSSEEIPSPISYIPVTIEEIEARVNESFRIQREEQDKKEAERLKEKEIQNMRQQEILASSRETMSRNQEVLNRTQETLDRLQQTIQGVKETQQKFKDFEDAFQNVMNKALESFIDSSENLEELRKEHGEPRMTDISEVAYLLADRGHISIIIGAGVSSESGVLTYKDSQDTVEVDGRMLTFEQLTHFDILEQNPMEFWQGIQMLRMHIACTQPNPTHFSIQEIQQLFTNSGRRCSILSTNFDGFDRRVLGDSELYETHGNLDYNRCLFGCCESTFPGTDPMEFSEFMPMCPLCGALARPHLLLFDENYSEELYQSESAAKAVSESEAIIVIGSSLTASLPQQLVRESAKSGKLIIEINIEPVVQYGNVIVIPESCGNAVPQLTEMLREVLSPN